MAKQNEQQVEGGEVEAVEKPKRVIKVDVSKMRWKDHRILRRWSRGEATFYEKMDFCDQLVEGIDDELADDIIADVFNAVIKALNTASNPEGDSGN